MAPCICRTARQRNRLDDIEFSHFIVAYCAQIGWFMGILWPLEIVMLIAKRTKRFGKLKSAILFQCTRQVEWMPACLYAASNCCSPLLTVVTILKIELEIFHHNLKCGQDKGQSSFSFLLLLFGNWPVQMSSISIILTNFFVLDTSALMSFGINP